MPYGVTGISSMFKRIFFGYLAVLIISLTVLAIAFNFTVRQYLISDTVASLHRVAETLSASAGQHGAHGSGGMMRGAYFSLANRIGYADYVLLVEDSNRALVIDSSDLQAYPPGSELNNDAFRMLAFSEQPLENIVKQDLVAVAYPVNISGEKRSVSLILYSRLDLLTQLNRSILGILALALGAAVAVSLVAGALATKVVVGPLQMLKNRAAELAGRKFEGKLEIRTGDELEALANSFNEMAGQLSAYDRAQKDFFQQASHELKTPLMSVQGYAEALKEGVIPAGEKEQSLEIIIKEAQRMKALVDELIFLSRMETLSDSYNFEPVCLEEAVNEAAHALKSLTLERALEIKTSFTPDTAQIEADPEKLHRLLLNIIGNALRYARHKITVRVENNVIIVEDDGQGFAPGEEEKAFEPFYRGIGGHTGLGLTISRAIAHKHGASISASASALGGARITIAFPH